MFNISPNGFIPKYCLEECPQEFKYLDVFINKYQNGQYENENETTFDTFRQEIKDYEIDVSECITNLESYIDIEIQKIYSITSFLAHLYVWGDKPDTNIPKCIAIPWFLTSQTLGIASVLTHAAIDLYNWRLIDEEKSFSLDNIEPQYLFNLDPKVRESERCFYLPMIAIEGECGCIIHKMEEIYQILESYTAKKNQEKILKNLEFIEEKMKRQYEILQTTLKCDPEHFYYMIRPYLGGSKQKDFNGWYLEGIEMYVEYVGGSAAQSSLIPAEDTFLGIKHPKDKFLKTMREYMPEGHRNYLENQEGRPGFPELQKQLGKEDYLPMEASRQRCVKWLKKFRYFHKEIVQKYVVCFNSTIGTGGTDINVNLNCYIKNTELAKIELDNMKHEDKVVEYEFINSISSIEFMVLILIILYLMIIYLCFFNTSVYDICL